MSVLLIISVNNHWGWIKPQWFKFDFIVTTLKVECNNGSFPIYDICFAVERENSISSKMAITDPRTRPLLKNDARNGGSVENAPAGTNITPTPVKIERPATLNNRSLSCTVSYSRKARPIMLANTG